MSAPGLRNLIEDHAADASKAVSEARGVPLVGLKIQPLPRTLGLEDRLKVLDDAMAVFG